MWRGITNSFKNACTLDLRSLALMRIFTAVLVIHDAVLRFASARAFTTANGVLPLSALPSPEVYFRAPLHALSDAAAYQYFLLGVLIAVAGALFVGYRTRAVTILAWFLLGSLHERNVLILHSSDTILRLILFWGIFLPWGERFALGKRGQDNAAHGVQLFAGAAYMLQCALIYICSVAFKTGADWWQNYSAVYYAVGVGEFSGRAGASLGQHFTATQILTGAVLATEFFAPFLLFIPRLRAVAVIALMGLHAGFGIFLNLGPFPFIGITSLIGLLPSSLWNSGAAPVAAILPQTEPRLVRALVAYFALFVLAWNLLALPQSPLKTTPLFMQAARILHLDQSWAMFSPQPPHESSWLTSEALLANGTRMDIWNQRAIPTGPTRSEMRATFSPPDSALSDWRWFKYLQNLKSNRRSDDLTRFAQYLCRDYNAAVSQEQAARTVAIHLHRVAIVLPGEKQESERRELLFETDC